MAMTAAVRCSCARRLARDRERVDVMRRDGELIVREPYLRLIIWLLTLFLSSNRFFVFRLRRWIVLGGERGGKRLRRGVELSLLRSTDHYK